MHAWLQHPSNNFDAYISGEVMIAPSAAIAAGVLLQASPNGRIVIGAGVCIGMGAILHAYEGTLEVEAGANLGAGVLIVGRGKIGVNACIGATTTILNRSIEPGQVVAAGSLIGDESRRVASALAEAVGGVNGDAATPPAVTTSAASTQTTSEPTESVPELPEAAGPTVYGQAHLNRMLSTMFPHRQSLSRPLQDDRSPSDRT